MPTQLPIADGRFMSQTIYDTIKKRIIFGEYDQGERLEEKLLSKEFKVSRTPLRDVFKRLEWEKFIEIVPRGAIRVTSINFSTLKDIYFLRLHIEGLAGRLSVKYAGQQDIRKMSKIREQLLAETVTCTPEKLIAFDMDFREVLNISTGNLVLKEISDDLYNRTLRMFVMLFPKKANHDDLKPYIDQLITEIGDTIKLIEEGDQDKAENYRRQLMIVNIDNTKKYFLKDII